MRGSCMYNRASGIAFLRPSTILASVAAPPHSSSVGLFLRQRQQQQQQRRSFAVYAVGEGWTGALGTGRLDEKVAGHFDDVEDEENVGLPVTLYENKNAKDDKVNNIIRSVSVGWGHTAVITNDKLLVTGRPHDFSALLRLRRLPVWLRNSSVKRTLRSTTTTNTSTATTDDEASSSSSPNSNRITSLMDPTSLVERFITWMGEIVQISDTEDWEAARQHSFMSKLTEIAMPKNHNNDIPVSVACSAGLTAVLTASGGLYTFGLNSFGQCGIGTTSNNVWQPSPVMGLSSDFADRPRALIEQSDPIVSMGLGLQHGICLNSQGNVFAWGKGDRGQLGQDQIVGESHAAMPILKAFRLQIDGSSKPFYERIGKVKQVAAGMIHSAALTEDNQVLLWGKHILPKSVGDNPGAVATDARLPVILQGLPSDLKVEQIACGSHHTTMLLEDGSVWAVGISSDTMEPIHEPVLLIQPGVIEMPVRQFAAHMDRTTIVGKNGRVVLQVHLWKDPELQEFAVFSPTWVDRLLEQDPTMRIREVHRSWVHSVVVTD